MATRVRRWPLRMPDVATRRGATGVTRDYFVCAMPLAVLGQYNGRRIGERLSLDMGQYFKDMPHTLRAKYNKKTAEWLVDVNDETWSTLMAFLTLYQVWFSQEDMAWLEQRCEDLNEQ